METNISDYDPASLTLFKSYYVVWKPFFLRRQVGQQFRLNRTM